MVRLLALVYAIVGVDTVFFSALTPLLPHYAAAAGLSKAGAGILIAAYPAGTLIGSLPSGALVARFGDRTVAVLGLALMGVSEWRPLSPLRISDGMCPSCARRSLRAIDRRERRAA